jgi:hypothetical protein
MLQEVRTMAVPVRRTAGRGPLEVWEPFGIGPWDPVAEMRTLTERFSRLVNELTGQWPSDGLVPSASAPLGELEEHGPPAGPPPTRPVPDGADLASDQDILMRHHREVR